jgi:hypothetical protein
MLIKKKVIAIFAHKSYLFHYPLWEYYFLWMCTFSGTQLGHKPSDMCIAYKLHCLLNDCLSLGFHIAVKCQHISDKCSVIFFAG